MTEVQTSPDACVDAAIAAVGKDIRLGAPLGLGKPVQLLNAFYRRAEADRKNPALPCKAATRRRCPRSPYFSGVSPGSFPPSGPSCGHRQSSPFSAQNAENVFLIKNTLSDFAKFLSLTDAVNPFILFILYLNGGFF